MLNFRITKFLLILTFGLLVFARTVQASSWQVYDYPDGRGANAILNIYLQTAAKPAWASLIVDYGTVRNCSAGLGLLVYTNRDLGQVVETKKSPDITMNISIDGQNWNQNADALRMYENGSEIMVAIYSQQLLDALAFGKEATVSIGISGVNKIAVAFDIRGGITAINNAYDRCSRMIQ